MDEKDSQVSSKEKSRQKSRKRSGRPATKDFQNTELGPGLNIFSSTAQRGSPPNTAAIEETMAPLALNAVSDWVLSTPRLIEPPP